MRHHDAPVEALAEPVDPLSEMELRILSGCHEGACLAIAAGERLSVGSEGDCDVLLSDCGLPADAPLQVVYQDGRWAVLRADHDASPNPPGMAPGAIALIGQVQATICAAHLAWTPAMPRAEAAPAPEPEAVD
ncbi:hypothetical protein, partial [Acidovorax cavernicola]